MPDDLGGVRNAKRKPIFTLLLTAIAMLVALVILEIGLRILRPLNDAMYQSDAELIYVAVPNARSVNRLSSENGGEDVVLRFNDVGYRSGASVSSDADTLRVAVYGDSFVEAWYTAEDETFVQQLGRRLGEGLGRPVEAINAGIRGYGPDQALLRMKREVALLRPDVLILTVFADNDYGDLLRNKLIKVEEDQSLVLLRPALEQRLERRFENKRAATDRWMIVRMVDKYFDAGWLKKNINHYWKRIVGNGEPVFRMARRAPGSPSEAPPRGSIERSAWLEEKEYRDYLARTHLVSAVSEDHYELGLTVPPDTKSDLAKIALMRAVVAEWAKIAASLGTPSMVLVVPSPVDACDDYEIQVDQGQYPGYDPARKSSLVTVAATRVGLAVVDMFEPYREAPDCNALFFHHGNNHWNSAGQALAASLVAKRLLLDGRLD